MILLKATTEILELLTTSTAQVDVSVSYVDVTTTTFAPSTNEVSISTATTTTILAAPGASTQRQIKLITIRNRSTTTANTVTVKKDISATEYYITPDVTLSAGETYQYQDGKGWLVLDRNGRVKTMTAEDTGYNGRAFSFYKVGSAPEATGQYYSWHKDSGAPGAWSPGTPGLAGRTTDGTTVTDAGCIPYVNPATGSNYLAKYTISGTVAHLSQLVDVLWINTGAVVTTTTAQTVNSVTFPARDMNGSTNGVGIEVAILVTTATTNAGAITNMTMSYTNSDGTAGRTATIASFPATAVIGTVVKFQLQAGDIGVRSIQTLTLGTSLATGAVSLVAYRVLSSTPMMLANVGTPELGPMNPGVKLYNGTCMLIWGLMASTTSTTITGNVYVMER